MMKRKELKGYMKREEGIDYAGRKYIAYTVKDSRHPDGSYTYKEYQLHEEVAKLIKAFVLGRATSRAISIAFSGTECQMTGMDLVRLAAWTLNENKDDWHKEAWV